MSLHITKATNFYKIQDAVASNVPVDEKHEFYIDFSKYRDSFKERQIYRHLAINPTTKECTDLSQPKKLFLSGYRGTGKTSELLKLKNAISETKCYLTIFVDISDEELDTNNIQTVDIMILMLEKLLKELDENGADINQDIMKPFYAWYSTRIKEVNNSTSSSISIDTEASVSTGFLSFFKLTASTKSQLKGSGETKEVIRRVFNQHFSDFTTKFNEFVLTVKEKLNSAENSYTDILFIVDGFEKIGTLEDMKKILIDDSNKFTLIHTNMMLTLPVELFNEGSRLNHFSTTLRLPLIDLDIDGAEDTMKEFILKRVDRGLFKDEETIAKIIEFGAGHPRQTLQIISRAYVLADEDILDKKSIGDAVNKLGKEFVELNSEELEVLKSIEDGQFPPASTAYFGLKAKNILFEYSDEKLNVINPILKCYPLFKKRMESLNA